MPPAPAAAVGLYPHAALFMLENHHYYSIQSASYDGRVSWLQRWAPACCLNCYAPTAWQELASQQCAHTSNPQAERCRKGAKSYVESAGGLSNSWWELVGGSLGGWLYPGPCRASWTRTLKPSVTNPAEPHNIDSKVCPNSRYTWDMMSIKCASSDCNQ